MKYNIEHCIGARLRRLSRVADSYYRSQLANFNITESQMTIIFALSKLGKVEQGVIGQLLVLQRSTVSRNVKLLEKRSLLVKTTDYRPEIELTKKGKKLVETLLPLWESIMDELIGKIGKTGMKHLEELEKKLL